MEDRELVLLVTQLLPVQGLWHCALILATGNSDSALLLGAESITSPRAFPTSASSAKQSLRAYRAKWDRDTKHNRVAKLGVWGGSWRLTQVGISSV